MKSLIKHSFISAFPDLVCYSLENEKAKEVTSRIRNRTVHRDRGSLANPLAASKIKSLLRYERQRLCYDAVAEGTASKGCETLNLQGRRALRFHLGAMRGRRH
jgi:hypothetical protein